jgi:rare lipoprotein A
MPKLNLGLNVTSHRYTRYISSLYIRRSILTGLFFFALMFGLIALSNNDIAAAGEKEGTKTTEQSNTTDTMLYLVPDATASALSQETILTSKRQQCSFSIEGTASYYADDFHGRLTANGQRFDMNGFTAAHKTLPFGSILRVTNTANSATILVMVNDRGPYSGDRVLDLSRAAARAIDMTLGNVKISGYKPSDFHSDSKVVGFTAPKYDAYELEPSMITVIETYSSFTEAIRMHRIIAGKRQNEDVYLIVAPAKKGLVSDGTFTYAVAVSKKTSTADDNFDTSQLLTE